jgi:hypothetical protein
MKIGTSITWLAIILIAFGYVLSDDQHIRKDLKETLVQMEGLNGQVVDANQKLNSCLQTVQEDQQVIADQKNEIASLYQALAVKGNEIGSLTTRLAQQGNRISELENHLATMAEERNKAVTVQSALAGLPLDPLSLAVIIIVQVALFILQRRHKNGLVRLSAEERAHIIHMRRRKKM